MKTKEEAEEIANMLLSVIKMEMKMEEIESRSRGIKNEWKK